MTLAAAILHVLVSLATTTPDDAETARLGDVASAIAGVTSDTNEAALLLAIARHESGFRRAVDVGEKRGAAGECGLWQIMPSRLGTCAEVVGDRQAQAAKALKLARQSIARCGRGDAELAAYASGRCDRGLVESKAMVLEAGRFAARLTAASTIGAKGLQ